MISVSNEYKDNLNNKALSPKSKIIVDGVVYLGNVIKTFPKIKHQATDVIGCFPAKTVSFEIYDYNNELDFINKEVEVYQGFMINGIPVYVMQGIFIPKDENVKTNISNKVISFENVQDRTQLLEDKYESNLDWSNNQTHTGLEIVQEICTRKQITLKTSNFSFANYQFKQPNFPENITDRQVIARLSEIGGENAYFDYDGKLVIKGQTNTNDTLQRSRYEKISVEKTITYNTVVLGKKDVNDDIVYPSTIAVDRVERRIEDNPFVDLIREEIIENVAQHIIGLTYTPYELQGCVDGHIYELNDVISVIDRNGNTVRAVVLDFENSSRIKSKIKLSLDSKNTTNYNLAGSNKESLDKIRLDVDHINDEIDALVDTTDSIQKEINPTDTSSGSSIYLKDSAESELIDFELEGKTTQETRSGKNLLNIAISGSATLNGITYTVNKDNSITLNGTATDAFYLNLNKNSGYYNQFVNNEKYTSYLLNNSGKVRMVTRYVNSTTVTLQTPYNREYNIQTYAGESNIDNFSYLAIASGTSVSNLTVYPMIIKGEGSSNEKYEQYGVSPSPDYPSELFSVGYENLYEGSQDFSGTWNGEDRWETDSQTYNGLVVKKRAGSWNGISKDINVINGEKYTFSVYIKCDEARQVTIYTGGGTSGISLSKTIDATTDWERYSFTFTATANGTVRLRVENRTDSTTNYTYICGYQLEKGKEVRSYIPYGKYGFEVKTTGKNFLNINTINQTINGLTIETNSDKTITINGTATATTDITVISSMNLNTNTYTLSGTPITGGSNTYKMQLLRAGSTRNEQGNGLTFTTTENYNDVGLIIKIYSGQTLNNITFKPQLEQGTQKTTYEPYKSNTYLYTLDQPLRSIGDTKDLLYIKNGMLYVDRKIGIVVLDGSEIDFYDTKYYYIPLNSITPKPKANGPLLSNYFVNAYGDVNGGISTGAGAIAFSRNSMPSDITTFSQFKAWLSTHNVEVQYILAEPYTEELGSVQTPSTYEGITYLNTTDGLEPNMNITYVRDTLIANYVESHVSELKINEKGIESRVQTIEDSDYGGRIDEVKLNQTSTDLIVDVISTKSGINLDYDSNGKPISGKVTEVTTINGMTFNKDGLNIHTNQSTFNAQHTYDGTYYRDGEEVITETTINGFKATNLKNKGQHEYSYDDVNDIYEFIDERVEVDGKYCYATFYNGEE